jgi:hypothetical protein
MAESIEKCANAIASQTKEEEKISSNIRQMLLNLGTLDRKNPAPKLTDSLEDLMNLPSEDVPLSLDIMMNKEKAFASPTLKFLRGIHSGNWTFDTGFPDNCCIVNLPPTLAGTTLENIDMAQLLRREHDTRSALTEEEHHVLYSSITVPSRSFYFLLNKVKAWKSVTSDCFGPNSVIASEAKNWTDWLTDEMELLQQKAVTEDEDLPCRIECIISALNNQYARASIYGVPSDEIIKANHIRDGIIQGICTPTIPNSVTNILHPPQESQTELSQDQMSDSDSIQMDLSLASSTSIDDLDVTELFPYPEKMNPGSDNSLDSESDLSHVSSSGGENDYDSDSSLNTAPNTTA